MNRIEEYRKQLCKDKHAENKAYMRFLGRVLSVLGMLVAIAGALVPSEVGPLGLAGILMGALGFALDARRLGAIAVILSLMEILLGILMS